MHPTFILNLVLSTMDLLMLFLMLFCIVHGSGATGTGSGAGKVTIYNNCPYAIWPAWIPNQGYSQIGAGGTRLEHGQQFDIVIGGTWEGRFWARTNCNFDNAGRGHCETGDCGGQLGCKGSGTPPATLAEFTPRGRVHNNGMNDYYSISLTDGFNLPIRVIPTNQACPRSECAVDLNAKCPRELQQKNAHGYPVGCKSACLAMPNDIFCCRKAECYPTLYSQWFKGSCPHATTYPRDGASFACDSLSGYSITFCP